MCWVDTGSFNSLYILRVQTLTTQDGPSDKQHSRSTLILSKETQPCNRFCFVLQDGWFQAEDTEGNYVGIWKEQDEKLGRTVQPSGSYLKRYVDIYCLSGTMGSPWLDSGTEDLTYELFISSPPLPLVKPPQRLCYVVGDFLMYLSLEPIIYGWNGSFCACTWYLLSIRLCFFCVRISFQYFYKFFLGGVRAGVNEKLILRVFVCFLDGTRT